MKTLPKVKLCLASEATCYTYGSSFRGTDRVRWGRYVGARAEKYLPAGFDLKVTSLGVVNLFPWVSEAILSASEGWEWKGKGGAESCALRGTQNFGRLPRPALDRVDWWSLLLSRRRNFSKWQYSYIHTLPRYICMIRWNSETRWKNLSVCPQRSLPQYAPSFFIFHSSILHSTFRGSRFG